MRNLEWLYGTNDEFHDSVCEACTAWLGNTSANFADAWLRETHREQCVESDYEDLRGQHSESRTIADMSENHGDSVRNKDEMSEVDTREKLEADVMHYLDLPADCRAWGDFGYVKQWLDRQAAITQREWEVPLMKAGHDAVQIEREIARKKYEELQSEIDKRDKGIERLKRRRDELEEELRQVKRKYSEKLADARTLPSVERVRELEDEVEYLKLNCDGWEESWETLKAERDELKAEQLSWPTMSQYKEACSERDAYRELCGRMRKMAQEMANMEVD